MTGTIAMTVLDHNAAFNAVLEEFEQLVAQ